MRSNLLVTSKSSYELAKKLVRYHTCVIVHHPPENIPKKTTDYVIAVGGGSVIDTAKMMSDEPIYAIPTTASGAAMTSWAVVWGKKKTNVKAHRPILLEGYRNFEVNLPADVAEATFYDCLCHILDSRASKKRTRESLAYCDVADEKLKKYQLENNVIDLIEAGNFAGRAIEITGTNFYHALSYVLTLDHGLEHGQALKQALLMSPKYNWSKIIKKAQKYQKFFEVGV